MSGKTVTAILAGRAAMCLVAMGVLWVSGAAHAQSPECGPHDQVVKVLAGKYQERRAAIGLINNKAMMEAFVSNKGTWTLLITNDARISCVLAAGDNWEYDISAFKPGRES